MTEALIAPFPYFGGKSKVADIVWQALGQPRHYIEPFFGSGAVLLARPDMILHNMSKRSMTPMVTWRMSGDHCNGIFRSEQ